VIENELADDARRQLLALARRAIEAWFDGEGLPARGSEPIATSASAPPLPFARGGVGGVRASGRESRSRESGPA
jgi:hypothetical protein